MKAPSITNDPRFRAGRKLVQAGKAHDSGAIDMFATIVEESRRQYGESSVESAAVYYEYGNALFRAAVRRLEENLRKDGEDDGGGVESEQEILKRSAVAAAAEKRAATGAASSPTISTGDVGIVGDDDLDKKPEAIEKMVGTKTLMDGNDVEKVVTTREDEKEEDDDGGEIEDDGDDVQLAIELMENSWSILDEYVQTTTSNSNSIGTTKDDTNTQQHIQYLPWAINQLPRILLGIGDVFGHLKRHADAVDAYTRAIPYRERAVEEEKEHLLSQQIPNKKEVGSIELLKRRRHLVEVYVLVAEELLACLPGQDVVTSESKALLVKDGERIDFARGYYDKARDELQETVFLMGKLASTKDLGTEKEDVCFLATMLMGVGTSLAECEEEDTSGTQPATKKQKQS